MNWSPVSRASKTIVSAAPASLLPPNAELDVVPLHSGVGESSPHRDDALVHTRHAVVAPELMHADTDDCDVVTHLRILR